MKIERWFCFNVNFEDIMTLSKLLHSPVSAFVVGGLALGLVFYYFGNQPLVKQAQQGLNGVNNPVIG